MNKGNLSQVNVVMTNTPHPAGEFVELECPNGHGMGSPNAEWVARDDGLYALQINLDLVYCYVCEAMNLKVAQ